MRDIKFRAWAKEVYENGELAYGGYMVQPHEIKTLYLQNINFLMTGPRGTGIEYFVQGSFLPGMGHMDKLKFDEIDLMQFTGLKDRNDVDIYENDIVACESNGVSRYEIRVVCYDKYQTKYKAVPLSTYHANAGHGGWSGYDLKYHNEVIGNIYENPELLK